MNRETALVGLRWLKPYPTYKDSGVEWLGDIPAHWEVKRIKNIARLHTGGTPAGLLVEAFEEEGIPWVKPEQLRGDCGIDAPDRRLSHDAAESLGKVKAGSTLVCGIGTVGKTGHAPFDVCTNQQINAITFGPKIISRYGQFMVACLGQEFARRANKVTIAICNKSEMGEVPVSIPQAEEQRFIASFLDHKTTEIDQLIEKKERLIELLQEKRTALITQAVTKGLDPSVPMKDSGVEWLGEIPAHWKVYPFKYLFNTIYRYPTYFGIEYANDGVKEIRGEALGADGHIIVLENQRFIPKELNDKYYRTILEEGDLVMSVRGTMGKIAYVDCRFAGANITANLLRLSPRRDLVDGQYLVKVISSTYFDRQLDRQAPQTTIKTITMPQLAVIPIAIPPKAEQLFTASFLDREIAKIDVLAAKIQEAIDRLKEYHAGLISAAVTGKIDVRPEMP